MSESVVEKYFGSDHASVYDERWKKTAPMSDLLHFFLRTILLDLPAQASILSVGAGTGAEALMLARHFPEWTFTAVEPSGPMLDVCRQKAAAEGFTDRFTFHEGYLASLSPTAPFDAATSILVSQFLTVEEERKTFFRQIAERLKPGARLITADLATDLSGEEYDRLLDIWLRTHSGKVPPASAKASCSNWGKEVAVSKPKDVESLLTSAGFVSPIMIYQALFIRAWLARAPA